MQLLKILGVTNFPAMFLKPVLSDQMFFFPPRVLWTSGLRDYADPTCPKFWPPRSNFSEYMDPLEL